MSGIRFERVTLGISRTVFLVGGYAIKMPCARYGWAKFLRGLLANMQERAFGRAQLDGLCPVLFADPLGFVVVMPRATPMVEPLDDAAYQRFVNRDDYVIPVENKADSFGYVGGHLVAIDYGN